MGSMDQRRLSSLHIVPSQTTNTGRHWLRCNWPDGTAHAIRPTTNAQHLTWVGLINIWCYVIIHGKSRYGRSTSIAPGKEKSIKKSLNAESDKSRTNIKINDEIRNNYTRQHGQWVKTGSHWTGAPLTVGERSKSQSSEIKRSKKTKTTIKPNKSQKTRVYHSKRNKISSKCEKTRPKGLATIKLTPKRSTTGPFNWQTPPNWNSIWLRNEIWSGLLLQSRRRQSWTFSQANRWTSTGLKWDHRNTVRPKSRETSRGSNIWRRRTMSHDSDSQS